MLRTALGALRRDVRGGRGDAADGCGLPAGCTHTWDGGAATDNWDDAGNWTHRHRARRLGRTTAVACIPSGYVVFLDSNDRRFIDRRPAHRRVELEIRQGAGLFVNGSAPSIWDADSAVDVTVASLGGNGPIVTHGLVTFTSGQFGTFLTSVQVNNAGALWTGPRAAGRRAVTAAWRCGNARPRCCTPATASTSAAMPCSRTTRSSPPTGAPPGPIS